MKAKATKRAKIMLPKIKRAPSNLPTVPTEHSASGSDKPAAVSEKPIFSSTLQDGPVMLPNEIRLVFESEFSTIREDGEQFSEREIPTFKETEARPIQENFEVEVPLAPEKSENSNSANNASAPKCQAAENHKKGCSVCFKSEPKETGNAGDFVIQRPKNLGGPFCSSFREDISHAPDKLQLGSENNISMVAGPSKKRYYTRSSVASKSGRNLLTTFPELDETNNLFGVGPPEKVITKMHDSASQHEFRYYDGIRQRYCSSFKENGFDVPGIIRLPFDTNTSMSTIVNPADEQQASDSFELDEETLQNSSGTIDDSVDSMKNSNSMSPPLKTVKRLKEPFCSSFRPSISCEPSHMTFNQEKIGPTVRPRKLLVGSIAEKDEDDGITITGAAEADDKDYSDSDFERSYEEDEVGMNKCAWMEKHFLCCVVCSSVDMDKCVAAVHDSKSRSVLKTKTKFSCGGCGKHFTSKSILNQHILVLHEGQRLPCSQCNKSFGHKEHLKTHVVTVHEEYLNVHILTVHEGKKPFKCSACAKGFGQKQNLERHKLTVHEKQKLYICARCGNSFSRKEALDTHILTTHDGTKPHKCPKCEKCFGVKRTLDAHLLRHEGLKPYTCSECSKSFTQKSYLNFHLKTHAESKPFRCNECPSAFPHKCLLSAHMKLHSTDSPYQCKYCDQRFKYRSSLNRHKKTHNVENKTACNSEITTV